MFQTKAGNQRASFKLSKRVWVPAFAGKTEVRKQGPLRRFAPLPREGEDLLFLPPNIRVPREGGDPEPYPKMGIAAPLVPRLRGEHGGGRCGASSCFDGFSMRMTGRASGCNLLTQPSHPACPCAAQTEGLVSGGRLISSAGPISRPYSRRSVGAACIL
jgi:hypothetical protein